MSKKIPESSFDKALKTLKPGQTMSVKFVANYPYEIRRMQNWDFRRAELDVWYELWEHYTNWRGKLKWRPVGGIIQTEFGTFTDYRKGDLAWAKRTAKQFNLKVPKW